MRFFAVQSPSLLLAAIVLVVGSPASARAGSRPQFIVHGGLAVPAFPDLFVKGSSLGTGGGVALGVQVAGPLMIIAHLEYATYGLDADGYRAVRGIAASTAVSGGEVSTLYASANLKISVPYVREWIIQPYLIGGVGLFRWIPDDVTVGGAFIDQNAEGAVGVNGGGGLDLRLGSALTLFGEGVFVTGFTEDERTGYVPVRVGVAFEFGSGAGGGSAESRGR